MQYFGLDQCIVYVFLLLTLGLGLYAGRGIKDIKDYAIAGKMYGPATLVIALLATALGGSNAVGATGLVFSDGIIIAMIIVRVYYFIFTCCSVYYA